MLADSLYDVQQIFHQGLLHGIAKKATDSESQHYFHWHSASVKVADCNSEMDWYMLNIH